MEEDKKMTPVGKGINRCDNSFHINRQDITANSPRGKYPKQNSPALNDYHVTPIDDCYWEKICDEALSMRSSIHSTADTSLSTRNEDTVGIEEDIVDDHNAIDLTCNSRMCKFDHTSRFHDNAGYGPETYKYINDVNMPTCMTSPDSRALQHSARDNYLELYCPGNGTTVDQKPVSDGRQDNVKCSDLTNISKKRLSVLNGVLSILMVSCCIGGILFLIFYMFSHKGNET